MDINNNNNNSEVSVSEAQNAANEILNYMDLTELFSILELDEGELLTQLILENTIDISSLYAFLTV